jgi:signal transduction histidine kinase
MFMDGRHMWRVLDNLLNNVCKYSLSGTRVYISLVQTKEETTITFKNISKAALNIASDELLERFVRGDSSRNTEGSGLGLSIAQSLTELMNGSMNLEIDGDLFKVTLRFKTTNKNV